MQGATLEIGEVVDSRYRVISLIGRGGMGAVFEAHDVGTGARVALKVLVPEAVGEGAMLARFEREAQLAAKVDAAGGVVRVHSFGVHGGSPYFVMDFVEGRDLGAVFEEGPMEPVALARILESVARTVEACHAKGVVHRDLKPANVLVRTDGRPLVADFGLAQGSATERLTRTGELLGSPQYMAPEQARADGEAVTAAADVYAMGAMLYHGLVGRPPFVGASVLALLAQVVSDDPVVPSEIGPVPEDLEAVCLKALAKDPAHRYRTAGALADDLGRFARGEPVEARPVGWLERFSRRVARRERNALASLVAGVGLLLIAVSAAVYMYGVEGPRRQARASLKANADLSGFVSLVERAPDSGSLASRRGAVLERIAALEAIERAQLSDADAALRESTLEALVARRRLLDGLARLEADPRASVKINSAKRKISPLEQLVDALLFEARGLRLEALERLEGLDPATPGVAQLRARLLKEIEDSVRRAIAGAVRNKEVAVGNLTALRKSVPEGVLIEAVRKALNSLATEWGDYMLEVRADGRLHAALEGIAAILQATPGERPGPELAAAINASIDALLDDMGERTLLDPGPAQLKAREHILTADAIAYSQIDPQRTPSEKYLAFIQHAKHMRGRPAVTLAAMRYGASIRFNSPPNDLEKLADDYPWSRAVRFWQAARLLQNAERRAEEGLEANYDAAIAAYRVVVEANEPGLLDDLPPDLALYAWVQLALTLFDAAAGKPEPERAALLEQADAALDQVRGKFEPGFQYLTKLAAVDASVSAALRGFEAGNAIWLRSLPLIEANAANPPPAQRGDLTSDRERQAHANRTLTLANRDYGVFLLQHGKLDLAEQQGLRALATIRSAVKGHTDREVRTLLAGIRNLQRNWKGALEVIEPTLNAGLDEVGTTRETVRALVGLGDLKRARELWTIGFRHHPKSHELLELDAKLKSLGH